MENLHRQLTSLLEESVSARERADGRLADTLGLRIAEIRNWMCVTLSWSQAPPTSQEERIAYQKDLLEIGKAVGILTRDKLSVHLHGFALREL